MNPPRINRAASCSATQVFVAPGNMFHGVVMFRAIHRLFRLHKWTTFAAVAILATGMGLCFGMFSLFTTLVSPVQPGIVNARFVTLGISQARGPLATMRWHDFERLRSATGDT